MSDGPHRSLPMKPGWKRVAERCDKGAFSAEEIGRAIVPALQRDCQEEMTPEFLARIRDMFQAPEQYLFDDAVRCRLEALRGKAGFGIGRTLWVRS